MEWLIFMGIAIAFFGLLFWLVTTSRADAIHRWEFEEAKRTMQKNKEKYKNAEKIYTRPRPPIDDAIDGL